MQLIQPITSEEVYTTLKNIDDLKAPGIDGLNAYLFKKAWPVVGPKVTETVKQFFATKEMWMPINVTSVTLIPKVKNPIAIKEYIPIILFALP